MKLDSSNGVATLQALLDAAVDGIITIDPNGVINAVNASAERIFKYVSDDLIGKNISMLMPSPYSEHHDEYLADYARTREPKIIGKGRTVVGLKSDGVTFPVELSVGEISTSAGIQGFIGIVRDISARVQAEDDARQNREQLAHVTRLNSMGEMAAGIAHEVNQPLTAIASYSQACRHLLNQAEPQVIKVQEVLKKIDDQAIRASEVIQRLRRFVKKRDGEFDNVNIQELISDTLALAKTDTRLLDFPVEVNIYPEVNPVLVDAIQVQQVLLNLIRNGVDAMSTAPGSREKKLSIEVLMHDPDGVEVIVRDFGPGLSEEAISKLFHPFYTTKSSGMGIGLCVSRSIVRAHGGDLWYQAPQKGNGAEFHFTLSCFE